jgi:hypothetical protein
LGRATAVVRPLIARVLERKHAVRLTWSLAGSGARPTAFGLRYSQTGYPLTHFRRLTPSSRSALVTGLTSRVSYRFVLVARAQSRRSAAVSVTATTK